MTQFLVLWPLAQERAEVSRRSGKNLQLVLMTLKPGEEIGEEVHADSDQFFRLEEGSGEVRINGEPMKIKNGDAVLVPAGARHFADELAALDKLSDMGIVQATAVGFTSPRRGARSSVSSRRHSMPVCGKIRSGTR
jgi:quercetin dioxygenase-like cupin family protein